MRYDFTKQLNTIYNTSILPNISQSPNDLYIISREGDRLDALSYQFYDSAMYWWVIAVANDLGKGSLAVPPGIQLRIPQNIDSLRDQLKTIEESR